MNHTHLEKIGRQICSKPISLKQSNKLVIEFRDTPKAKIFEDVDVIKKMIKLLKKYVIGVYPSILGSIT